MPRRRFHLASQKPATSDPQPGSGSTAKSRRTPLATAIAGAGKPTIIVPDVPGDCVAGDAALRETFGRVACGCVRCLPAVWCAECRRLDPMHARIARYGDAADSRRWCREHVPPEFIDFRSCTWSDLLTAMRDAMQAAGVEDPEEWINRQRRATPAGDRGR